jgi:predicted acyl esterase
VFVSEVLPDGTAVFLADDTLRARYREDDRKAKLVPKGVVQRYEFNHFPFIARRIQAGSRLRLVFAPLNTLYSQKNYNSGGVVSEETAKDARTVTVQLYHDAQHPSALFVPIAAPASIK